jgi:predicted ATPase
MSDEQKVGLLVDNLKVEVDGKPITMLFHNGTAKVVPTDADVVEIDPERTVRCAKGMAHSADWQWLRTAPMFVEMWQMIWGKDSSPPIDLDAAPLGMQHTAGMLVLLVGVIKKGKRPFLRLPETYLHPAQQTGLGDLLILLMGPAK